MIVRPTIRGEARQIHPETEAKCNCHDLRQWLKRGEITNEGFIVGDELAKPLDWIVKIDDEVRVVKAKNFTTHYEEMTDEDEV